MTSDFQPWLDDFRTAKWIGWATLPIAAGLVALGHEYLATIIVFLLIRQVNEFIDEGLCREHGMMVEQAAIQAVMVDRLSTLFEVSCGLMTERAGNIDLLLKGLKLTVGEAVWSFGAATTLVEIKSYEVAWLNDKGHLVPTKKGKRALRQLKWLRQNVACSLVVLWSPESKVNRWQMWRRHGVLVVSGNLDTLRHALLNVPRQLALGFAKRPPEAVLNLVRDCGKYNGTYWNCRLAIAQLEQCFPALVQGGLNQVGMR